MELQVNIVRFVSREPQPGVVACEFTDAGNRIYTLIDKVPIFSLDDSTKQALILDRALCPAKS